TAAPGCISLSEVHRKVSAERSAENVLSDSLTTVRQQPFTAMLEETTSEAASGPASTRRLAPASNFSISATRPTCSTIPVNMLGLIYAPKTREGQARRMGRGG